MKRVNKIKNKGITLVALVITIIILLILAGISIASLTGSGLLTKSQSVIEKSKEAEAREKLELIMEELQILKVTDKNYNEGDYITDIIKSKENITIIDDATVLVDNTYKFGINRAELRIVENLGKDKESQKIRITSNIQNSPDYTKTTIICEIEYEGELIEIRIDAETVEIPEKENGKYTVQKDVTNNGSYNIYVKSNKGEYKTAKALVTEIAEDFAIKNADELAAFRDKVNKGATYEGKTITVASDIDLSGKCSKELGSWEPIGNYEENNTLIFKGIFDGQGHKITGLYIENDKPFQGLFGVSSGEIKNIIIDEGHIKGIAANSTIGDIYSTGSSYIGAVIGMNLGGKISNCTNKITVEGNASIGGIAGQNTSTADKIGLMEYCNNYGDLICVGSGQNIYAGGIAGENFAEIKNCKNMGKLTNPNTSAVENNSLGGIVGFNNSIVTKCNNQGEVINTGVGLYIYACGIAITNTGEISECSNEGQVSNIANSTDDIITAGITGYNGGILINVYNTGTITCEGTGKDVNWVGGLVGYSNGNIANCFNKGAIIAKPSSGRFLAVGGLVAGCDGNLDLAYNAGTITNTGTMSRKLGSIAGYNDANKITNCHYLSGTYSGGVYGSDKTGTKVQSVDYMKSEDLVTLLNSLRKENYLEWEKTTEYPGLGF